MNHTAAPALRVALIGYGYVGQTMHAPLIRATPDLDLVLVGSSNHAKVQADLPGVEVNADYLAVAQAPGVDLVVIASPNDSHHPLAKAALLAGKAVVIDKPFTVTLAEATELVELAEARGLLLSVFHNRRWDGDFLTIKDCIQQGHIGEVREFISRFDRYEPVPRNRWRERPGPGAGLWMDLGPHLLDQAIDLFGMPEHLSAELSSLRDPQGCVDHAQVVLHYEQPRRRITLRCSRLNALPSARFEVHGQWGSLACHGLDLQESQLQTGLDPTCPDWGQDSRPLLWADWRDIQHVAADTAALTATTRRPRTPKELRRRSGAYETFYAQVQAALLYQTAPPVSPDEALRVMYLLELAEHSSRTGKRLPVQAPRCKAHIMQNPAGLRRG